MNTRTPEELEELAKDVIELNTPARPWKGANDSTPRTDAAYELAKADVDREISDGWDLARKLELELQDALVLAKNPPMYVTGGGEIAKVPAWGEPLGEPSKSTLIL